MKVTKAYDFECYAIVLPNGELLMKEEGPTAVWVAPVSWEGAERHARERANETGGKVVVVMVHTEVTYRQPKVKA